MDQIQIPKTILDRQAATKAKICGLIEQGIFFKNACILSGITEQTGYNWKRQDFSFFSQCEAAISKYKAKLIACVNNGAVKDARVALAVLKIRFPDEWNPKSQIKLYDPQVEIQKIHNMIYGTTCPRDVH